MHTVHLLTRTLFTDLPLGPALRVDQIARSLRNQGQKVVVHALSGSQNSFPPEIGFRILAPGFMRSISTHDQVVASELLGFRALRELLATGHPFHWDCYGLSLPETACFHDRWSWRRSRADRIRKTIRYRHLAKHARTVWVSTDPQADFLAGILASSPHACQAASAVTLPERLVVAPMGVRSDPFPEGSNNPFPEHLHGQPVFLWGGGIWRWFDVGTVVDAVALLAARGVPGAVFFISGRNEFTADYDRPLREAVERARSLGLLGTRVVFNDQRVGPKELAPWLEHCTVGVMGNSPTLESRASWRTRYLDLVWAGRGLVASGFDPLAGILQERGAAKLVPAGNALALADTMAMVGREPGFARELGRCAARAAETLQASRSLSAALSAVENPSALHRRPCSMGSLQTLRYLAGI